MLIKGNLLSATNLNNAYISKTDTNAQSINSTLSISGGALTLKNSIISDNASSQYMQIDPQGNKVIIYDGVNNQRLDVYSSSGSESTYITTVNGTKSIGILDVSSAIDHLEIATNSSKPVVFGSEIKTTGNTLGIQLDGRDAPLITRGWDAFTSGKYNGIGKWGLFMEPSTLTLGVNQSNGNFQFARYSANSTIASVPFFINTSDNVGIGTTSPSQKLDVNGIINIQGSNSLLFGTYGGGFNMTDTTWIRTTGSKSFYHNSGEFRTDGTLEVGNAGATLSVPNGGTLSYSGGRFSVTTAGLTTINGSLVLNTSQALGSGIKLDGTTIDTVGGAGNIAIANLNQLRFGSNNQWDYNQWAGIKYDSPNKILYIGGPASSHFSANASPSQIATIFDGLSGMGINMTPRSGVLLDVSGDIGISSGHSLWVGNNATSGNFTRIHNNGTDAYIDFGTNLHIRNNGASENLFISSNGYTGLGTTTPARKLDVNGDIRLTGALYASSSYLGLLTDAGGALPVKVGSLAITSSYGNSAPTNGLYVQGAVGIGTTSPSSMFQVNEASMSMFTNGDHVYLQANSIAQYPYLGFVDSGGVRGGYIGWGAKGSHIDFTLENGNNLYINGGNVGIGKNNPAYPLDVVGNIQTNGTFISTGNADVIQLLGTGNAVKTLRYDNSAFRIWNSGSGELMTFTTSGNVGVNQPAPKYTLDVNGTLNVVGLITSPANNNASMQVGSGTQLWDIAVSNTLGVYGASNTAIGAVKLGSTGPTLFGSGGTLGIGTTTPWTSMALDLNGSMRIASGKGIYSGYNNAYFLNDHANGNITLSAASGNLYLGYQNTQHVYLSTNLTTTSSTNIIGTDGTLYYKGSDTDGRYINKGGDTVTGNVTFNGTITAGGTLNYKGQDVDSRYLLASGGTASGTTTFSGITMNGNMQINNGGFINGIGELYGAYGTIAKSTDEWLRLNDDGTHTSGVYFGSSIVRTDGQLQVGNAGSSFLVDTSGNTTMTGTLKVNRPNTHIQLQESGNNTWHIESVNNELHFVRTGVSNRMSLSDQGHVRLESYFPGWNGWRLQLGLNSATDGAIWHEASDLAFGMHTNGTFYWMSGASQSSGGAYIMSLDTTQNKLMVGGNEIMQKGKNISYGTSSPTGGSSGDIYVQI